MKELLNTKERNSQPAKAKPLSRKSPSKQRVCNGHRDSRGKFLPGNAIGFKPGQSGNLNGRRDAVADQLRRKLAEVRVKKDGRTNAELIADVLLEEAIEKRNLQAIKEILDRVDGKPRQALDVTLLKNEAEKYENMIFKFMESAKSDGVEISREQAIAYLAEHDSRILELFPLSSPKPQ